MAENKPKSQPVEKAIGGGDSSKVKAIENVGGGDPIKVTRPDVGGGNKGKVTPPPPEK